MHLTTQKIVLALSVLTSLDTGISTGTISLTNAVPHDWIPFVVSWAGILAWVCSTLTAALAGNSIFRDAGTPPPVTAQQAAKAAAFLLAFILTALIFSTPGYAQPKKQIFTGDIARDIANARSGGGPISQAIGSVDPMNLLAKPFKDLADFIESDSAAAITLSTQIPELQDGHGQQCWIAMSTFGAVFKAHPVPATLKAQTDIEALRLLAMTANNLCINPHCTQVFADLATMAQSASPVPLPIPSLHDLCSKIPQIAQVAPITPPAAAAAVPAAVTPVPVTPAK